MTETPLHDCLAAADAHGRSAFREGLVRPASDRLAVPRTTARPVTWTRRHTPEQPA